MNNISWSCSELLFSHHIFEQHRIEDLEKSIFEKHNLENFKFRWL